MKTVFLDTETTGLRGVYAGGKDEMVELAILDDRGNLPGLFAGLLSCWGGQ